MLYLKRFFTDAQVMEDKLWKAIHLQLALVLQHVPLLSVSLELILTLEQLLRAHTLLIKIKELLIK
jgi:hypothetical protein